MANPTTARLSPAELRRRLLAPPTDGTAPAAAPEEIGHTPLPPRMVQRRDPSKLAATMAAIDLESLALDVPTSISPKTTPPPEMRLDAAHFRTLSPPPAPVAYPTAYPPHNGLPAINPGEVEYLRAQNAELARIIEEMRPLLEEASQQESRFQAREHEYQAQVAERDTQIDELKTKVVELEQQIASIPPPKVPKTRDELEEWSDELEKEAARITQDQRRLETDRQQLREDEESLENQMREMEVSMARERALMARQETELKRLSAEIQHELEVLQRGDGELREQLSKFQRKHQEVLSRSGGPPPAPPAPVEPAPAPAQAKDSGLLRRLFRGK